MKMLACLCYQAARSFVSRLEFKYMNTFDYHSTEILPVIAINVVSVCGRYRLSQR